MVVTAWIEPDTVPGFSWTLFDGSVADRIEQSLERKGEKVKVEQAGLTGQTVRWAKNGQTDGDTRLIRLSTARRVVGRARWTTIHGPAAYESRGEEAAASRGRSSCFHELLFTQPNTQIRVPTFKPTSETLLLLNLPDDNFSEREKAIEDRGIMVNWEELEGTRFADDEVAGKRKLDFGPETSYVDQRTRASSLTRNRVPTFNLVAECNRVHGWIAFIAGHRIL